MLDTAIMHTSQYTMGVDVADANNDGFPEIISMDMLPEDPYILKRSEGEDAWDTYTQKLSYGYNHQYTRNNLQLNRRNGHFSEIGLYSGVAATDWSWSPLWVDFDNDGLKDLFISNGIPRRLNDIDYINFIFDRELQQKTKGQRLDDNDISEADKFPQIKLPSKFFKNEGKMVFSDQNARIQGGRNLYSNGAVYADLDNDGDLDIIVNNIDDKATIYRNTANDHRRQAFLDIKLRGPAQNRNALGAKLILFSGRTIRTYEKYPVRGFLSSMELPLHVGLQNTKVDSLFLVWPDNSFQRLTEIKDTGTLTLTYQEGLPVFDYSTITAFWKNPSAPMEDITAQTNLRYDHKENDFHEFDREPLLPHMLSTEGPPLAVADIDKDGSQDVFIGSSKWKKSAVFLQHHTGRFQRLDEPALDADSTYEDTDASWADINNDGKPDLLVASGGNEFYGNDTMLTPRAYLNDGKGHLTRSPHAFPNIFVNASCIVPCDFNHDGFIDLFIGGRSVPWDYGQVPRSYLLQNDGTGKFTDVTEQYAKGLAHIGFVTNAVWVDLDKDGRQDLLLSLEWGGILAFMHTPQGFTKKVITDKKGWWNFILPVDLNGDGNLDIIAGNLGLNSRLKASAEQPVRLFYYDFDANGKKEQILTYYVHGQQIPFANKEELEKQMPGLKKRYLYAEDFAKATLEDLFTKDGLQKADTLSADYFSNAILINRGDGSFNLRAMPWEAQLAPFRDAVIVDANNDSLPDILLVGNYYENNIQMGRYDADYGTLLLNEGRDSFSAVPINGLAIKGQTRHVREIGINGEKAYILARNDDSVKVIRFAPANKQANSQPNRKANK
ncbi:MAG TPA: VCBS repeat-containing protein, partial [Puia sp.]|nr:VCBS repeat-containing protein [Puia sp.]